MLAQSIGGRLIHAPGMLRKQGRLLAQGPIEGSGDLGLAAAKDAGLNVAQC